MSEEREYTHKKLGKIQQGQNAQRRRAELPTTSGNSSSISIISPIPSICELKENLTDTQNSSKTVESSNVDSRRLYRSATVEELEENVENEQTQGSPPRLRRRTTLLDSGKKLHDEAEEQTLALNIDSAQPGPSSDLPKATVPSSPRSTRKGSHSNGEEVDELERQMPALAIDAEQLRSRSNSHSSSDSYFESLHYDSSDTMDEEHWLRVTMRNHELMEKYFENIESLTTNGESSLGESRVTPRKSQSQPSNQPNEALSIINQGASTSHVAQQLEEREAESEASSKTEEDVYPTVEVMEKNVVYTLAMLAKQTREKAAKKSEMAQNLISADDRLELCLLGNEEEVSQRYEIELERVVLAILDLDGRRSRTLHQTNKEEKTAITIDSKIEERRKSSSEED